MSPDNAVTQYETRDQIAPTSPHGIEEGIALALRADESGDWKLVADWLARNAELAGDLARFLAGQRDIESAVAPVRQSVGWESGTTIGGFALRDEIGRGGMGVVYRAHDPVLKRDVAMKVVRTGAMLSADDRARFRFEAESAANLDHPNIVRVFAFGESDGMPYLVMPLMEGGSLAQRLKSLGPDRCLAPKDAAGMVRDIALGVHHAHQRGLIHRDLKPGNILLDAAGRPHVADFGLARSVDVAASVSGAVAGTPAYMAPEQARGAKVLTLAADVHALGGIMFELLTGRPPFAAGGDWFATLKRIQEEPAPSVRGLRPDAPADIETICRKCLEKDPSDRYSSAQALAVDLSRFIDGEPLAGHPRRGVMTSIARALDRRRETLEMSSWATAFWGAASSLLALIVFQVAVLASSPNWVSATAMVYYLVAWIGIVWWRLIVRRDSLNPVESNSMAVQLGMVVAAAIATMPYWLNGESLAAAFQPLAALVGLGIFVHGAFYWGRLYVTGLLMLSVAAIMPLIPVMYWPGVYGLAVGGFQILVGFHLAKVDRQARSSSAPR